MKLHYREYFTHARVQLELSLKALFASTDADMIFVATLDNQNKTATTLCMLNEGKLADNITYSLPGSPCEDVTNEGICIISKDVSKSYPDDLLLAELNIKSYVGEPIRSIETDEVIGILAALFKTELVDSNVIKTLFSAFSARIASDIHYEELSAIHQETLEELAHKHQLMSEIEVISKSGGWEFDIAAAKVVWTDETFRIHGLEPQKAPPVEGAINYYTEEGQAILEKAFSLACEKGIPYNLELELIDANGTRKWVKTNSKARRNEEGNITHVYGAIEDISERKEAEEALNQLAYFDPITTLQNSHCFERDFRKLLLRNKLVKGQLYVAIIDVDRFSEINLAYGLRSGDGVLLEIASRIQQQLSADFELYRAQADGFVLIYNLPITQNNQNISTDILRQELAIKKAVSANLNVQKNQHSITVSIGSLMVESDSATYETVLSLLEFSRKEVKTKGSNARILLTEVDYLHFERQKAIRRAIQSSMNNDEFFVVLQPKFDVGNNIVASELLLRWNHSQLGSVSPSEFIAVAEQTNDIVDLSRWVFKQACRLICKAKAQGCETKVAVNISGKDLIRPDFASSMLNTIQKYHVQPSSFILEITETILVSDIKLVASKIESMSNQGFEFSIDDFGTGYSSLAYLRSLKIHELKIDMLFVKEISEKVKSPIVDSIIQMAKALGLVTVAEGVETQLQLSYLKKQGCDLFQGYLLSKPISEKEWLEMLRLPKSHFGIVNKV